MAQWPLFFMKLYMKQGTGAWTQPPEQRERSEHMRYVFVRYDPTAQDWRIEGSGELLRAMIHRLSGEGAEVADMLPVPVGDPGQIARELRAEVHDAFVGMLAVRGDAVQNT
jgi:hypothetical protein